MKTWPKLYLFPQTIFPHRQLHPLSPALPLYSTMQHTCYLQPGYSNHKSSTGGILYFVSLLCQTCINAFLGIFNIHTYRFSSCSFRDNCFLRGWETSLYSNIVAQTETPLLCTLPSSSHCL